MNLSSETWDVINSFFRDTPNYLVRHHIDSYNDFINKKLQRIFKKNKLLTVYQSDKNDDTLSYQLNIYFGGKEGDKFYLSHPTIIDYTTNKMRTMFPNEARLKNLTYGMDLFYDVEIDCTIKKDNTFLMKDEPIPDQPFMHRIMLGTIPIMLQSDKCVLHDLSPEQRFQLGECRYDQGGYFIVDGTEKVIISQERKAENIIFLGNDLKYQYMAEIKSISSDIFGFARTTKLQLEPAGTITVRLGQNTTFLEPDNGRDMPLFAMFRVLGVETDKEIVEMIVGSDMETDIANELTNLIRPSIMDPTVLKHRIFDIGSAEAYLKNRPRRLTREAKDTPISKDTKIQLAFLYQALNETFFPHVGVNMRDKAYFLGYMTRKLLLHKLGIIPATDKDNHQYKRFDLSGHMLAITFKEAFLQVQRDCRVAIGRKYQYDTKSFTGINYFGIINPDTYREFFTMEGFINKFTKSIKVGTFGQKKGVGKVLDRHCWPQTLSELRRIIDNVPSGSRVTESRRRIHATQYGNICYVETPTGQNIGLNKHLAMLAYITSDVDPEPIHKLLLQLGMIRLGDLKPRETYCKTSIFLNGKWVGCTLQPYQFITTLRLYRRNGLINAFISISWETLSNEIKIWTDNGRMCHPNYILENNQFLIQPSHIEKIRDSELKFTDLLVGFHGDKNKLDYYLNIVKSPEEIGFVKSRDVLIEFLKEKCAVVEYIDPTEMDTLMMAADFHIPANSLQTYTHHEIHSSMALSASTHLMSYANNNNGARNLIASKHVRQGMGIPLSNFRNRIDGKLIQLHHPQRPLTFTRISKHLMVDKLSTGQNLIIAIGVYAGFNEDDAVCANRASCEMGMLNCTLYKMYEDSEKYDTKTQVGETFYNPMLRYQQNKKTQEELEAKGEIEAEYPKGLLPKIDLNYDNLDKYGFIKEGTYLKGNEVVVSKFMTFKSDNGQNDYKDASTRVMTDGDETVIDKVFTYVNNADGHRTVKIRTAQNLGMGIGDKLGSRCDQKGAIGELLSREDMPYTEDGLVPDIIINPFTYCKRMTLNQLIELMFGNLATKLGCYGDCSPMMPVNIDNLIEIMDDLGLHYCGDRTLYSGITGQQMEVKIFMGSMFYQRLFYMPRYKINARLSGERKDDVPVPGASYTARDRSVLQGRSKEGGMKIGEMERDCLIAHGVMSFLKESMMERGDKFIIYVSRSSGMIAVGNPHEKLFLDTVSDGPISYHLRDNTNSIKNNILGINTFGQKVMDFFKVEVPYSFKQLIYEMQGQMYFMRLSDRVLQKMEQLEDRMEDGVIDIMNENIELEDEDIMFEENSEEQSNQDGGGLDENDLDYDYDNDNDDSNLETIDGEYREDEELETSSNNNAILQPNLNSIMPSPDIQSQNNKENPLNQTIEIPSFEPEKVSQITNSIPALTELPNLKKVEDVPENKLKIEVSVNTNSLSQQQVNNQQIENPNSENSKNSENFSDIVSNSSPTVSINNNPQIKVISINPTPNIQNNSNPNPIEIQAGSPYGEEF
jgi:DNA-directed RNA polymerase II subunit RPB2